MVEIEKYKKQKKIKDGKEIEEFEQELEGNKIILNREILIRKKSNLSKELKELNIKLLSNDGTNLPIGLSIEDFNSHLLDCRKEVEDRIAAIDEVLTY